MRCNGVLISLSTDTQPLIALSPHRHHSISPGQAYVSGDPIREHLRVFQRGYSPLPCIPPSSILDFGQNHFSASPPVQVREKVPVVAVRQHHKQGPESRLVLSGATGPQVALATSEVRRMGFQRSLLDPRVNPRTHSAKPVRFAVRLKQQAPMVAEYPVAKTKPTASACGLEISFRCLHH